MKVRSIHIDMKGVVPKIDHLLYLCNNFAYFGYNYLLLEFEDKFPFSNYQFMHHKAAYRKKELAKLNTFPCKVIPLLQCAGHLDYLLKHPQMRHLRKNNSIYQWNMAHEEVFTTWQNMADEILEIYPDCEYFHIGADEVEVFNDGDFEVFTKHVERCANYLIAKGKKVIIWDDMFRKHDIKTLQSLVKKVIIQVWQYREVDESIIAKMVNAGATVWGASRVQELESYNGLGFNNPIKNNIDQWIKINQKYNLEGHTGTFWGRVHSTYPLCAPLHQAIFMIAYLGNALTTNTMPNWEEFCQKMALFFGDETLNIDKIVFQSGYEPDKNKKLLHEVPQNNEIMEVVTLLNEYDSIINYIMACFKANWMMYNLYRNGDAPPKTTLNYLDGVRIIKERIKKLKDDIDSILGKYFHQAILDEFKSSRFDALFEINSQQEAELKNGSKLYQEKYN